MGKKRRRERHGELLLDVRGERLKEQKHKPWVKHADLEQVVSLGFTERSSCGPTRTTRRPTLVANGRNLSQAALTVKESSSRRSVLRPSSLTLLFVSARESSSLRTERR